MTGFGFKFMKITTLLAAYLLLLSLDTIQPENCPTIAWSEGLNTYTSALAAFPTKDTAGNSTGCNFQQWSWESFVWATAIQSTGQPRFLDMPTTENLSPSLAAKAHTKKLVLRPRT